MLNQAGTTRFDVDGNVSPVHSGSTVSVLATTTMASNSSMFVFISNYHRLGSATKYRCDASTKKCVEDPNGSYTDMSLCNANCEGGKIGGHDEKRDARRWDCPPATLNLTLVGLNATKVTKASITRIDSTNSNPMAAWISAGSPTYPDEATMESMHDASQLTTSSVTLHRIDSQSVQVTLDLPPSSVAVLEIDGP